MNFFTTFPLTLWLSLTSVACSETQQAKEILTSGLTRIFWKNLRPEIKADVSSQCFSSLAQTLRGLQNGAAWSFAFIDASSKLAAGVLEGSPSSFGDYDQCLSIRSDGPEPFQGQHCMARLRIRRHQSVEVLKVLGEKYPVFDYVYLNQAICLPSACSRSEAEYLVNGTLQNTPLDLTEEFLCDTQESISWTKKFEDANAAQVVAISVLCTVIFVCFIGTIVHLYTNESTLITEFSIVKNFNSLAEVNMRASTSRLELLDYVKFTVIIVGVAGHCLTCLESIPSWYTFSRLYIIKSKFRSFWVQPMMNEAGLGLVTFVGGFVTFWSSHKLMQKGTFRMGSALYEKWIRFMPSIMMIVGIDLLWPMFGSGPMYTGIANHLLNKCTRNWWMNFFFISNFATAPENCAPHTFYSSIDMQLFVIGLLVASLLVKRAYAGVVTCLLLIVTGNVLLIHFTMANTSSPVLIDAEATREKTVNYLDYVHFGTYSHLSNYFIGMLAAYTVTVDGLLLKNANVVTILYNVAVVFSVTVHFAPALHNTFGLLPQHLVPYYIAVIKFFYVFYYSLFLFTNTNRYAANKKEGPELKLTKNMNPLIKLLMGLMVRSSLWSFQALDYMYSAPFFRLLINLTYAVYISNYSFIRYDFFTSRLGMELSTNTIFTICNRVTYSLWFVMFFGLLFQLFFVAPFDSLRRRFRKKADASHVAGENSDKTK